MCGFVFVPSVDALRGVVRGGLRGVGKDWLQVSVVLLWAVASAMSRGALCSILVARDLVK